jgi:gliding motility-associated-like protein
VIPNTFSPNNDEINDEFKPIINCELEKYEFLIFNRWGQLIFKTNNQNDRWDGKYKSVECPMGVYMYLVNYKFYSQESKNCYGDVLLLK